MKVTVQKVMAKRAEYIETQNKNLCPLSDQAIQKTVLIRFS